MVAVEGGFKIELVEANTKTSYKEHYSDGKVFVEVEPNAEYFVSIQRVEKAKCPLGITFTIDGKNLGWLCWYRNINIPSPIPRYIGLFERKNGIALSRALKFVTPTILNGLPNNNHNDKKRTNDPMIGEVRVDIYEENVNERRIEENSNSELVPDLITKMDEAPAVISGDVVKSKKTVITSVAGTSEQMEKVEAVPKGSTGKLLQSVTLYYGTVVGLIHVGVIPKPENIYEAFKLENPSKRQMSELLVEPKRLKFTKTVQSEDGKDVVVEEYYKESFDLSQLPMSDSEKEDNEKEEDEEA